MKLRERCLEDAKGSRYDQDMLYAIFKKINKMLFRKSANIKNRLMRKDTKAGIWLPYDMHKCAHDRKTCKWGVPVQQLDPK